VTKTSIRVDFTIFTEICACPWLSRYRKQSAAAKSLLLNVERNDLDRAFSHSPAELHLMEVYQGYKYFLYMLK
jgi:hypothetical protein